MQQPAETTSRCNHVATDLMVFLIKYGKCCLRLELFNTEILFHPSLNVTLDQVWPLNLKFSQISCNTFGMITISINRDENLDAILSNIKNPPVMSVKLGIRSKRLHH